MNCHKFFINLFFFSLFTSSVANAQNPVIHDQFTADPTARVFNNKVYMFPSHDIPAPDDYARKDWFCMADYHVFSSQDLVNWTDHGVILSQKDVPWGNPTAYSMWAPDCIEHNGKYYFYFPDAPKEGRGFGVGVAIADRPEGPYTPLAQKIEGISGIDPCVLQASDGNAYIFWGGGGLRAARLKDNLTELVDDTPRTVQKMGDREMTVVGVDVAAGLPAGFKEGPFAFEKDGKYYLTYPWVEDKTETLAYAMSDNPLGPYTYKGKIMEQSPTGCWTNHHSIINYQGEWYLFYHHNDYSPRFDKNRSARIDTLRFNADGTIQPVTPTLRGVGMSDAFSKIEIDRYTAVSGNDVEMSFVSADTTRHFDGWCLTYKAKGASSTYSNVKFRKYSTAVTLRVKAPQGGKLSLRMPKNAPVDNTFRGKVDKVADKVAKLWGKDGTKRVIATVSVPASEEYTEVTVPVKYSPLGAINLHIESVSDKPVTVDWVMFK